MFTARVIEYECVPERTTLRFALERNLETIGDFRVTFPVDGCARIENEHAWGERVLRAAREASQLLLQRMQSLVTDVGDFVLSIDRVTIKTDYHIYIGAHMHHVARYYDERRPTRDAFWAIEGGPYIVFTDSFIEKTDAVFDVTLHLLDSFYENSVVSFDVS